MGTAIYRSPEALRTQNQQKVSKGSSRASRPGVPKKCRKGPKAPKKESKRTQNCVRGLFRHFFDTTGGEAREDLFETFWGFWGSETPVYGDCNRKSVGKNLVGMASCPCKVLHAAEHCLWPTLLKGNFFGLRPAKRSFNWRGEDGQRGNGGNGSENFSALLSTFDHFE